MKDLINKKNCSTSNLKKSKPDFTVREVYFSNISKGKTFLLQSLFETDPSVARDFSEIISWDLFYIHIFFPSVFNLNCISRLSPKIGQLRSRRI